jgi:hypothetical protein
MVDDNARELAIYHALKAIDEVAAAFQAYLVEEHKADPDAINEPNRFGSSLKLLGQARERLGKGLRAVDADTIAAGDDTSLRRTGSTISMDRVRDHNRLT